MRVYIAGKITGEDLAECKEKFLTAEKEFKYNFQSSIVVNPMSLPHNHDKNWKSYMRECIKALVDCDAILMLKDYKESKGAKIELSIAEKLGLLTFFEE